MSSLKPVYLWGSLASAVALGVIGCAVYFSASHSGVGSSRKGSTEAGTGYIPIRVEAQDPTDLPASQAAASNNRPRQSNPPVYSFTIVNTYPHDQNAFTQGLVYAGRDRSGKDILYESTGLYGRSTVRRVVLQTGKPVLRTSNGPQVFGEGLAFVENRKKLMQVMWQTNTANLFDSLTLKPAGQVKHGMNDGWGLTEAANGSLYGSDGSEFLYLLDGKTYQTTKKVAVKDGTQSIIYLNELERINNRVFANVWQTPCIARINPQTGKVDAWLDFEGLVTRARRGNPEADVLNGIAWDPVRSRLFVTGKLWPSIFEVKLVLQTSRNPAALLANTRKKCWPTGGFL